MPNKSLFLNDILLFFHKYIFHILYSIFQYLFLQHKPAIPDIVSPVLLLFLILNETLLLDILPG